MPAARCTICALNFPTGRSGVLCPVCLLEKLDYIQNGEPTDPAELASRINAAEFERYYAARGDMSDG